MQPEEPEDIPDLFHKSSLRQRLQPQLPVCVQQIYTVKKWKDQHNNTRINNFIVLEQIGQGSFGKVFKVQLQSDQNFAMKVYNKLSLKGQRFFAADGQFANGIDMLQNELNILKRINHHNICRCYSILYTSEKVYSINELCDLGAIMQWSQLTSSYIRNKSMLQYLIKMYKLQNQNNNTQLSQLTRLIFQQICNAILYLHQHNITNRDIKVDNILCMSGNSPGNQIKIIDFTTVRYSNDDISFFPSGTPGFRGPQHQFATSEGYSSKASDVWSIGICLYTFYYQKLPFYGQSQLQIDIKAKNDDLILDENCPKWINKFILMSTCKAWQDRTNIIKLLEITTNP